MESDPRSSEADVHTRVTSAGRQVPAAEFPSGRIALRSSGAFLIYDSAEACPAEREDMSVPANTRSGVLHRTEDVSGVSGTGVVADFVRFPDGSVVQEWRNENNPDLETHGARDSGIDFRPSMSLAVQIHGHNGGTEYVYDNGEVAQS